MAASDYSHLSDKEVRDLLLSWRNNDERKGPDAVELGARLLSRDPGAFGGKGIMDPDHHSGVAFTYASIAFQHFARRFIHMYREL